MLIVRGRNHYSEDIEATVQKITRGRVVAIAGVRRADRAAGHHSRVKNGHDADTLAVVKSDVIAAISRAHGLQVADIVLVEQGGYSHHHQRKDPPVGVRRAAAGRAVRPAGCS